MGTVEAAIDFLRQRGRAATTNEIVQGIIAGGWKSKAKRKNATVFGMLHQQLEIPDAKIMRTGPGTWALTQWKPMQDTQPTNEPAEATGGEP